MTVCTSQMQILQAETQKNTDHIHTTSQAILEFSTPMQNSHSLLQSTLIQISTAILSQHTKSTHQCYTDYVDHKFISIFNINS